MENYPGNSQRVTATKKVETETTETKPTKKKVEKVVTSTVTRRPKPLGKKFSDTFVSGDARGVAVYVLNDVMLPAAKDMVADAVSQGIERMLFGDSTRSRPTRRGGSAYTSYNRITSAPKRDEPRREMTRKARAAHDFDEIILESRAEAEEVLDNLYSLVSDYDVATVGDLYELVDQPSSFTDEKWGWVDLRGANITRVRGGFLLDLPKPDYID